MINYLKSVGREFKNIQWPTKKITTLFTIGVIIISLVTIIYLGLLDFVFVDLVDRFLI